MSSALLIARPSLDSNVIAWREVCAGWSAPIRIETLHRQASNVNTQLEVISASALTIASLLVRRGEQELKEEKEEEEEEEEGAFIIARPTSRGK